MSSKGRKAVDEAIKLWMAHPDVTGVSISEEKGEEVILVLIEKLTEEVKSFIPREFKGFTVKIMDVGEIIANNRET